MEWPVRWRGFVRRLPLRYRLSRSSITGDGRQHLLVTGWRSTSAATGGVGGEDGQDTVTHISEYREDFLLGARGMGGIGERPVVAVDLAGENGARLVCISANGDDGFNRLVEEAVHVLAFMGGDVDPDFCEGADGEWVHVACGVGPGAGDFENVSGEVAKDAFCEVATAGVSGAQDEDEWFHGALFSGVGCWASSLWKRMPRRAPMIWAGIKAAALAGAIPANVSVKMRPTVTAGFAKEVEAVNQ